MMTDADECGCIGYDQLCRLDPRFGRFKKVLFSYTAAATGGAVGVYDRGQLTTQEVEDVDAAVEGFCVLLGPYVLLPAASQALEWLVRRFDVYRYNVESLMKAVLPYHETPEFVRCVQIMVLEGTCFAFLNPMKKSGAVLPRSQLVERCMTDKVCVLVCVSCIGSALSISVLMKTTAVPI